MARLHRDGQRGETVVVRRPDGDVRVRYQRLDDLHVAVFRGAHEGRAAVLVADVDVGPGLDQQLHHVVPAVADGQHESGLAVLGGADVDIADGEETLNNSLVGLTLDNGERDEHDAGVTGFVENVAVGHFGIQQN